MSVKLAVLEALKTGPKSNADIRAACGGRGGSIACACTSLIEEGLVRRIDPLGGKGSKALYALADGVDAEAEIARWREWRGKATGARAAAVTQALATRDRDTCDFIAERIAALKAQVANGKIGEDVAALTIRHLEGLSEMIALGLHHGGEAAA